MKVPIAIRYEGSNHPPSLRSFIVAGDVVVELKATSTIGPLEARQLLTYLRFTGCPLGLLINFGSLTLLEEIKRVVNNFPDGSPASDAGNSDGVVT